MTTLADKVPASPTVQYIVTRLTEGIASGIYKEGFWLPSEREMVTEFGVSRVVIRQALDEMERQGLVLRSPRCRPLVHRAAPAPAPVLEKTRRNIALWIWPNPGWGGAGMIVRGIQRTLNQDDFRVVLDSPQGDSMLEVYASEARFLERISRDRDIEGIILWYLGGSDNRHSLESLRAAGTRMVFLDRCPPPGFDADFVGVDNVVAAEQVVTHLLSLGHRRIAHITNHDPASTVTDRLAGYRNALERAGIEFRPELVLLASGMQEDDRRSDCEPLISTLLTIPDPPTAVFAVNDVVALSTIAGLRRRGLHIPRDMAVAGFDGIERWSPGTPSLTTADQPFERMGEHAAALLLRRLAQGKDVPLKYIEIQAPLAIYASTIGG